ncbi:allophanate hydrolase [Paenibacillus sp. MMS20-IR301]|uniref:allophanate hydrolase n=1 Tax=Paenibacillus sp. MMS20-IR301 TaxID=2895946 RepID=UPI0028ECA038|nr:allophanate hydrolase [Paenibacillus sp. MMS20-IR301]WNS46011.1 allophanate hydrolase [Paenibacillus sp. MMS20-IR301]
MAKHEIPYQLTVAGLRTEYLSGETTPHEIIREIIIRADRDKEMNIWITAPDLEFIQPYLDRLAALNPLDYPLWGIPFAIKDNIDLAGIPTTAGCAEYAYTPAEHAGVVERLVAAGAVPVGKSNLDQFATGLVGTRSPYGEAHNALRPGLISGGSSSGSSVAVARGQAAFALGTDTAGSGRIPAALHGLVGWKPSLGSWPTLGVVPACASLDCVTVMAHTLEDVLQVDKQAAGYHSGDPWSRRLPLPEEKQPQYIAVPAEAPVFYGPFADSYRAAWASSLEALAGMGIPLVPVDTQLFSEAAAILYGGPWVAERWADLGSFIEEHPGIAFPVTETVLRSGAAAEYDAASVFQAMHKLQRFKLEARKLLKDAVLVLPTAGGTWTRDQVREDPVATNSQMGLYTNHCNLLDLCAVALPAGEAAELLPFGISVFTPAEKEGQLRAFAKLYSGNEGGRG